jgi:hypothetical protein
LTQLHKIGFFVSDKRHFDYFKNVFEALHQKKVPFHMIVNNTRNEANAIISDEYNHSMMEIAQQLGYPYRLMSELIESRAKYSYVVTTYSYKYTIRTDLPKLPEKLVHNTVRVLMRLSRWVKWNGALSKLQAFHIAFDQKFRVTPEKFIGDKVILFPKGLDINLMRHPNPPLTGLVDEYFCHGPIDGRLIEEQTGKKPTMIGYPRYDTLKTLQETYKSKLATEFDLDPAKKIISWIPTYVNRNGNRDYNMDDWLPFLESLLTEYEILVRPHPKRIEMGADNLIKKLKTAGFKVDVLAERDMNQLYSASDYILCDYGGVVFSSIYTGSKLLMLNHSDHQSEMESHYPLFVYKIREQLLNIDTIQLKMNQLNLSNLLKDEKLWLENEKLLNRLLMECFGGIKVGEGSQITALKLKELLENS